jgi:molecular chaperone GrpE
MNDDTLGPDSNPFAESLFRADDGAPPSGDAQLALAEAQVAEQRDKLLRLAAEFDNFRKRSVRERQEAEARGMSLLVRGILDSLDDLGRFAHVDPAKTDSATLQHGVEMIEKKMLKSLAGHGLEIVNPLGHPFDPAVHEAVTTAPAESPEEDHLVAQVFQLGYLFNGQLLRPARVVVKQWGGAPANWPAAERE